MTYNYTVPRGPITAMFTGPGPCYQLPGLTGQVNTPHDPRSTHKKEPAFGFGLRTPMEPQSCSPGPKYKPNAKLYRDGMDGTPHYTMLPRRQQLVPFTTPGPAAYNPGGYGLSTHPQPPSYSMKDRTPLQGSFKTPAPNRYSLPPMLGGACADSTKATCPNYTMRAKYTRGSFSEDCAQAPGPGTYDATSPSTYKKRLPEYSISPRVFPPGDTTQKPGPGAHRPENCTNKHKKEYPSYTFGMRHSPYAGVSLTNPQDD